MGTDKDSNSTSYAQKHFYKQWNTALPVISRAIVWIAILGVLYLLRSFFLLIFLTFVFSYIQANGVRRLEKKMPNRTLRAVTVAAVLLMLILAVGAFIIPRVKEQATIFADRYPSYLATLDKEVLMIAQKYPILDEVMALHVENYQNQSEVPADPKKSISANLIQQFLGIGEGRTAQSNIKSTIDVLRNLGGYLLTLGSAFLLSLLFSFLIVLDLPNLTQSVKGLANTKLRFIYLEVADSIRDFGAVLGRALEAQLFIAIINTCLTAVGVLLLGLKDKLAFISLIVFLCSFIPVAGVFISSMPICLLALQELGLGMMFLAVLIVIIVHIIEAYILNPKIYGHHLRMNPVIVLIILTIGGKMFGVWGFILGVPICTYFFGHAIRFKDSSNGKKIDI
jgi:predicted PurR-regulated permease PerM